MHKARRNATAIIEFNLQRCFVAKQQRYLITQFAIKRYITKRFCLRIDTQR